MIDLQKPASLEDARAKQPEEAARISKLAVPIATQLIADLNQAIVTLPFSPMWTKAAMVKTFEDVPVYCAAFEAVWRHFSASSEYEVRADWDIRTKNPEFTIQEFQFAMFSISIFPKKESMFMPKLGDNRVTRSAE